MTTLFLSDMELDQLEEILDADNWDIAAALQQLGIDAIPDRVEQQLRQRNGVSVTASLYTSEADTNYFLSVNSRRSFR